jgi:YbgC/YbaW family acyl-CoA thioester hydrolase
MRIFTTNLTVRGYELDSYGHVNNAVYLQYLEQARWDLMKELGVLNFFRENGLMVVVIETNIRYMRECVLFDELVVETSIGGKEPYLVFHHKIRNRVTKKAISRATVKTLLIDEERLPRDFPEIILEQIRNKWSDAKM